jgi:predicted ATPase
MFNIATRGDEIGPDRYGRPTDVMGLHEMSHGEAFLKLALSLGPRGLYIMDEPESALSPQRQLAFLARMHQLVREGGQLFVSTHSPILMAYPGATLYELDKRGISKVAYEDTEHFAVTRAFLQNPARMIRDLFSQVDAEGG